ncbi:MAG: serine/threonine protein kinase [Polyangiaceae bacterium]|nr:serine/threonine protein kinase [Polyangiaceae bacterium]
MALGPNVGQRRGGLGGSALDGLVFGVGADYVWVGSMNRVGQFVAKRYRLDALIDTGGQSQVYRARDVVEGDDVAVKILTTGGKSDPELRERMLREAHALAQLGRSAAVRVLDQGFAPDGALATVMELLHGADFDTYLFRLEQGGVHLPVADLVRLMAPIVDTLDRAHAIGIVHRDLKPKNVYIVDTAHGGGVKLLDFGFAKFLRMRSVTAQGMIAGSPSYISPEAWLGEASTLDHRADVYGLAAVMFRALGGRPPFASKDMIELLTAVTTAPRPSLHALRPELPPAIDDWVAQSLAVDRDERFNTVRALFQAFQFACELPK